MEESLAYGSFLPLVQGIFILLCPQQLFFRLMNSVAVGGGCIPVQCQIYGFSGV